MPLTLFNTERFADHENPPGHPERPERAEVLEAAAARWRDRGVEVVAPREATHEQLARVHSEEYLAMILKTRGQARQLDPDTYTSADSQEVALLAAGAVVGAVERVMATTSHSAFALVRPPGHHAERGRAMGFCLYNNVAVGAAYARAHGVGKIAIVDYDVHHGNGTQHMFEADPHVLYVSTHQYPYYPGTGAASEIGRGPGAGFTVNLPIEAGAVAEDFHTAFSEVVVPVLRQFEPELVMVSAGFDAHEDDPLGGMRLTPESFSAMTMELRQIAKEYSRGRLVAVTEGGYDLRALSACLDATIETLNGPVAAPQWPRSGIASDRGAAAVALTRDALRPFWAVRQ
jgi:acetoin utilization deacetylase AcuC-like enzyme